MDLEGKRLLVLGGAILSCEIIKQAKRQGALVYVTDYLENSPGKKIADKSFMVSTNDIDGVVNLIKEENIDGVLTGFIEFLLPYYVEICQKSSIPCYATKEQIDIAINKEKFKKICSNYGIPVVEEYNIKYPFTFEDIEHINYPVLIKPVDNSGSRGIYICNNPKELLINYEKSLECSNIKNILVEKYMDLKEATIFYIIQDGEIYLSSMADRHVRKEHSEVIPLPVAYSFPSKHIKKYQEILDAKVIKMFKSIGIKNGMIFIQTFIDDGNCIFYEMGYRLTASLEYKIIEKLSGFNPLEMMINYALTGNMHEKSIDKLINPNYTEYGFNITFLARPGTVGKLIGIDKVKLLDGVLDVVSSYQEGDIIPEFLVGTLKQVIIRVFGTSPNKEDMAILMDKIHDTIKVYSQDGESMLLDVFDTRELF